MFKRKEEKLKARLEKQKKKAELKKLKEKEKRFFRDIQSEGMY